jgi:TonB-dependent starch-binding outer membrane protein SusC
MKKILLYIGNPSERHYLTIIQTVLMVLVLGLFEINAHEIKMHSKTAFSKLAPVVISGLITNEQGEPLAGANILLKGTKKGTTADANGNFRLELSDAEKNGRLIISFVGYESQEVATQGRTTINVILNSSNALDEVVVVGYGSVKKSDLTGSVSTVKAEQIAAYPAAGLTQALQGRAAGVQIQANNGDPGASFKLRIRGASSVNASSDPLFVVDGFVGGQLPPPEDIESIEILKDASATAIYGSRGANGVVMVTTKQGKEGKTRIEFNTSYSSQNEINRLQLLNAEQYTDFMKEANPAYVSPGGNSDWQNLILQKGNIQNHQLSFSGGNQNTKFYVSGSVFDQGGIIIGTNFQRYTLTNNLSFKINNRLNFGVNLQVQRSDRKGTRTQEGSGGANGAGAIASAYKFMPNQNIYNADGTFQTALQGDPIDNPYAIVTQLQDESTTDRLQANLSGEIEILKSLKFKSTFGISTSNARSGFFQPTTLNQGRSTGGDAEISGDKDFNLISENYLTFNQKVAQNHNITALAGYSFQKNRSESWGGRSQSFITDAVEYWSLGSGTILQPANSALSERQIESFFGRVNYSFKDRYIVTLNARNDGSSNFSKNFKRAFFPSGAIAWNVSNENFMKDVSVISGFKIRASYGLTGNQAIAPYQTLARFSSVISIVNGKQVNAVIPSTVANENLTWETNTQFDIGTDISFLNNRFNLTLDYYNRITKDLLFNVPLPQYSGYSTQLKNIGKVGNQGFEATLSSKVLTGDFKWNLDFNISTNRNKVLELPDGKDILFASRPGHLVGIDVNGILRVGAPVGSFYGWFYDGVYQQGDTFIPGGGFEQRAGGEKYRDINGKKDANGNLTGEPDGLLSADDRTIIGDPNPDFIYGINSDFKYKNFDLNVFFQGSQGNDMLSFTLLEIESMGGAYNSTTRALNRWTPTNTNTDIPVRSTSRPQRVSTRWVYDGSFLRLKNIALGYNFNIKRLGIQKIRVYASAQNILTFTNYPGYDPEVNFNSSGSTNSNRNLGLDYGSYPNVKNYSVGLNLSF